MPTSTTVDERAVRLHAAGWSAEEAYFVAGAGPVWQLDGTNGENRLLALELTQAGGWRVANEAEVCRSY